MTKIYLICAAQSENESCRVASGGAEWNITRRGMAQAEALAERLAREPLTAVYSSGSPAARATAGMLCKGKPVSCREDHALREMELGVWEGKNWGNISYDEPGLLRVFRDSIELWQAEGAETARDVQERMCRFLREIGEAHDGGTVAVVSHPIAAGLCLSALDGCPPVLEREGTALSLLAWEGDAWQVLMKDDISHLPERTVPAVEPRIDPLAYFCYLRFVEYGEMMADAVRMIWEEIGDARPYDRDTLLTDANLYTTLMGYVELSPAAFLQYGVTPGWITLFCVAPACRNAGVGTQLLGRAILDARGRGGDYLYIPLAKNNPFRDFFLHRGFSVMEEMPDGRDLLARDIRPAREAPRM